MVMMRLLDRLDAWKANFGQGDTGRLEKLLTAAAKWRLGTPAEAIRFHETLLFLRAYPRSPRVARLADQLLFHFADRIARMPSAGADMEPFEAPEVSGIAGTSLGAVFSYDVASSLAARHPGRIDIGWDRCDEVEKFGPVLARILPLFAEDWPTEAHVPFRDWIAAARPPRTTDLRCLPASAPRSTDLSICRWPGRSATRPFPGRGYACPEGSSSCTANRSSAAAMSHSLGNSKARLWRCAVSRGQKPPACSISSSTPPPCAIASSTGSATPTSARWIMRIWAAASRSSSSACRPRGACRCGPITPACSSRTASPPVTWSCSLCSNAPKWASTCTTRSAKANPPGSTRACSASSDKCSAS